MIEIIAVLVIISVMAALVVPKMFNIGENAKMCALEVGVKELNVRCKHQWAQIMLINGYDDDTALIGVIEYDLGEDYHWVSRDNTGGVLQFQGVSVSLKRTPSSRSNPPVWSIDE